MKILQLSVLVILTLSLTGCDSNNVSKEEYAPNLSNKLDTISYLYGYVQGKNLTQQGLEDIEYSVFLGAMNEAIAGEETKVDMIEGGKIVRDFITEQREKMGEENLSAAEDFLAKNKDKEGVKTTASGLQYEILQEGEGDSPLINDRVSVHYEGKLLNGEVFDSSLKKGVPASFAVNRVVRGWTEALQLMKVGSKYKLYVPPSLGYGERGSQTIGPNELLIFEVELLGVEKNPSSGTIQPPPIPQPK